MPNYQIITDSCCDFTEEMYRQYDVTYAPLSVLYKGKLHNNFSDEEALKEMYTSLGNGETATTSAANPEAWTAVMEPALDAGKDILCMCFSSGLSTTYQSAVIAAEDLRERYPDRKINVVDTLCAALGQGLLVMYACRKRDEGLSLEELTAWVEEHKLNLCHWVTIDDLGHLKRGGRVSATTALVGTMLNIKPIIRMDNEGKLETTSKVRGRKAAMEYLVKKMGEHCIDFSLVNIAHGNCPEDAAALEKLIRSKYDVQEIHTGYVGAVIGAHTGPGVLVVFFLGEHR